MKRIIDKLQKELGDASNQNQIKKIEGILSEQLREMYQCTEKLLAELGVSIDEVDNLYATYAKQLYYCWAEVLTDDYNPPMEDITLLHRHLFFLWIFFIHASKNDVPQPLITRALAAAVQLVESATVFPLLCDKKTKTIRRTAKAATKKKKGAAAWKKTAVNLYNANPKWHDTKKPWTLAGKILGKWTTGPKPAQRTLNDFLKEHLKN